MFSLLRKIKSFLTASLWDVDLDTLGPVVSFFVKTLRLITVSARDFSEGMISLRAMSLVYTSLLSLVPLLAVSFSVLKAFGVYNQMEPLLSNFLAPLGPKGAEITRTIISFVENMNVRVLGFLGLGLLIYTVVSLIQKIEQSFNEIWRVRRERSMARRFSDFMSVVLIGPVLVFTGLGLTASLMSNSLVQRLLAIGPVGNLVFFIGKIFPFFMVCAAFSFIYVFVPSTKVNVRSALVGGLFSGVLWETAGIGFASFIVSSARYHAIYSGFAILVFFMIWVYLSWLILLFGAKVAFYHQYPHFLTVRKEAFLLSGRLEEKLALVIMALIGSSHFRGGRRWDLNRLLARLRLPVEPVQEVLDRLEKKGLLLTTGEDPPFYAPARDIGTITLSQVLDVIRSAGDETGRIEERYLSLPGADEVARDLAGALESALGGRTVRDLVLQNDGGEEAESEPRPYSPNDSP